MKCKQPACRGLTARERLEKAIAVFHAENDTSDAQRGSQSRCKLSGDCSYNSSIVNSHFSPFPSLYARNVFKSQPNSISRVCKKPDNNPGCEIHCALVHVLALPRYGKNQSPDATNDSPRSILYSWAESGNGLQQLCRLFGCHYSAFAILQSLFRPRARPPFRSATTGA